jgi:hypothetical protein
MSITSQKSERRKRSIYSTLFIKYARCIQALAGTAQKEQAIGHDLGGNDAWAAGLGLTRLKPIHRSVAASDVVIRARNVVSCSCNLYIA